MEINNVITTIEQADEHSMGIVQDLLAFEAHEHTGHMCSVCPTTIDLQLVGDVLFCPACLNAGVWT